MTAKLPISVCVCTFNAGLYIRRCLDAILANEPAQVIVVDGGSTDGTWHLLHQFHGVTRVMLRDRGLASQRQLALDIAENLPHLDFAEQPYHMIVDAHHVLNQFCLKHLYDEMERYGYDALQAQEWQVPSPKYWTNARASANFDITHRSSPRDSIMVGRPALYRTAALRAIGGFDSRFDGVGDEDTDVSIRMQMHGYRQGQGTGIANRVDELDLRTMLRKFVKYGRGDARIIKKYPFKRWAIVKHLLWAYPWSRGLRRPKFWPYYALCGWVRFYAMVREMICAKN